MVWIGRVWIGKVWIGRVWIGRVWLWGLGRTFNLVKSNNYPLLYRNVLHNCNKVE